MSGQLMVDVSSNNHPNGESIDWRDVHKAGYKAAMVKCSEGLNYVNSWRISDGHGAASNGMLIGYYHFAQPGQGTAVEQAEFAVAAIAGLPRSIGLALDLEVANGQSWAELADWAKEFLATIEAHKILATPIYTNRNWYSNLPGIPFGHPVWLASPGQAPRFNVWAWQSGVAKVPGIAGSTDIDVYYGG